MRRRKQTLAPPRLLLQRAESRFCSDPLLSGLDNPVSVTNIYNMPSIRGHPSQEQAAGAMSFPQAKKKYNNGTTGLTNLDPANILSSGRRAVHKSGHMNRATTEISRSRVSTSMAFPKPQTLLTRRNRAKMQTPSTIRDDDSAEVTDRSRGASEEISEVDMFDHRELIVRICADF
jgi:hypothetical protein